MIYPQQILSKLDHLEKLLIENQRIYMEKGIYPSTAFVSYHQIIESIKAEVNPVKVKEADCQTINEDMKVWREFSKLK